jgi:hypothetical protein
MNMSNQSVTSDEEVSVPEKSWSTASSSVHAAGASNDMVKQSDLLNASLPCRRRRSKNYARKSSLSPAQLFDVIERALEDLDEGEL